MRLIFKFSLFTMAGVIASQIAFDRVAVAAGTPDSSTNGLGDTFIQTTLPCIETVEGIVISYLNDIKENSSVPSGDNEQEILITESQVATIRDAISSEDLTTLTDLQQQISDELGGSTVVLSRVGNSREDVVDAVTEANDLINSLDDQSLSAASESPTFVALLGLLKDVNTSLNSAPGLKCGDGQSEFDLVRIVQVTAPVVELEEPEPIVVEPQPQVIESDVIETEVQQPAPEPIRGLW